MADMTTQNPVWHSIRNRVIALAVLVGLFLAGGVVATDMVSGSIDQLVGATAAARQQASAAQAVLSALEEAETSQRGYLLTQRAYYLEPYYATIGRIEDLLARLNRRAGGVPWLEHEASLLQSAARQKVAELRQTIVVAQRDGFEPARQIVLTDEGKAYMDQAHAAAARIIDRAEAERAARANIARARQRLVANLLAGALCTGIVALGGGILLLLWNGAKLRQAAESELKQAARFQAAIEHVPNGVAVFDRDGTLSLANDRFGPTLGLPPELAGPGAPLAAIAEHAALTPPILAGARPTEPRASEAAQGRRSLELWRSPMPDGGQMLAVADITRRNAAEEVARQAQKMDVLGQMTGGVAHDFNNLLQIVSANLEMVRNKLTRAPSAIETPIDQTILARLDAASAGVARGARLTRHLLAFARRQPLAPEPLDAARVVMGMEDVLRRTLGEAIRLELVIGGGLWSMRADPSQFENALLNLALNARDAMTDAEGLASGRLTIEATNASLDEAYAARAAEVTPGQYVMFAVTDTGTGMTAEQMSRALEPFYTTKPEGRGTGLGLPMVLGFAKQSGGHFQLYSEPGQGTTARLYIPRTTAAAIHHADTPEEAPYGNGELVLLVEDDPAVRQAGWDALLGLNYRVVVAETADAALALLEAGCRPRIVFTDVVMPGQATARQMATRAQALIPGVVILFTSGYTQNSIVHNGQLDPDVSLISKPWRIEELARALQSALTGAGLRPPPQRRVLLVDDEELVRMTTADALAELGFDVIEAATGAAALARLQPPPDLLLTDLGLPDQDGLSLALEIRRRLPGMPVVVASGQNEPPDMDVVWLPKPYDVADLRRALATALPS